MFKSEWKRALASYATIATVVGGYTYFTVDQIQQYRRMEHTLLEKIEDASTPTDSLYQDASAAIDSAKTYLQQSDTISGHVFHSATRQAAEHFLEKYGSSD